MEMSDSGEDSNLNSGEDSRFRMWELFRVDISKRVPVESLLAAYSNPEQGEAQGIAELLGFGNSMTLRDMQHIYRDSPLEQRATEAFLIIKLSLALMSYGQTTVDAKLTILKICEKLGVGAEFHFSTSTMEAAIGGHSHVLSVNPDIVADKLMDVTALCRLLATTEVKIHAAVLVLDGIINRPLPYSTLTSILNLQCLFTWAAICAFFGDFQDLAACALIAPFSIAVMLVCKRFSLANIELCLVSLVIGIVTPPVWKFLVKVPVCHIPRWWASALLLWLPGTELINGAYEIKYGKLISGASQLMSALIRCAFMGVGLTIGWQFFGRDAAIVAVGGKSGVKASLVPSEVCPEMATPWYMIFLVYNFPMLFHCFVSLNMRLRDMPHAFLVVYPSLIAFIAISKFAQFPSFVADAVGLFIATNLASLVEYLTGTPVNLSLVPMIIILAPGAPAVSSVLQSMQVDAHVASVSVTGFWTNLALQGASYAFGLCLALEIWRPILHRNDQVKAQQVASIYGW
eukprot:CAMPEP_0197652706 /NCGR_PEP_ID=MMETSP1338-20131121/34616_1 /TAXON_ID=43686 ORGANISM="Pelagodinium beii, Strain RCC1491" /NCGR_SAMPLE_ID=MMETSP1338 /ASSEMBLY_ACC=CAM_ASM_000754 /LENGTH=514 /DNA_ID=CAMNT_0043227643 /DNA_START=47 /DNA_END=1588 /DNA_ORIENTATION=-